MLKEETKILSRNLGKKNITARAPLCMKEVEPYWKSLWGDECELNGRAQ
jgi:hypothetical protein